MNRTKLITLAALIVVSVGATCMAQDPPKKTWVWLTKQGVWGYGYQIEEGPHQGLWRIDPDTKRAPEELGTCHRPLRIRRHSESIPRICRTAPVGVRPRTFRMGRPEQCRTVQPWNGSSYRRQFLSELCLEHSRRRQYSRGVDELAWAPREYALVCGHSLRDCLWARTVLDDERSIIALRSARSFQKRHPKFQIPESRFPMPEGETTTPWGRIWGLGIWNRFVGPLYRTRAEPWRLRREGKAGAVKSLA